MCSWRETQPLIIETRIENESTLETKKAFTYAETKFQLGTGKYGTVELVLINKECYALKKIQKANIDSFKRV